MKAILHLHDFIGTLPEAIREELVGLCIVRHVAAGEAVYRQGDQATEMYQLLRGSVRMCSYSLDGKEMEIGRFRPGDCFGEMGLIDGMPRVSHAVANEISEVRVLGKAHFTRLYRQYPEISQQLNLMLCRRVRMLYGLNAETGSLNLRQRLARALHRLAYSQGFRDDEGGLFISASHEELGRTLGASRQSISKELKVLEREGSINLRYGKIYLQDLEALREGYEDLMGMEQVTAVYEDS